MSAATGLSVLDRAALEACDRVGARSGRPFVKTQRVLEAILDDTGIGPRTSYEPLCDLARSWVVHLQLIEVHGNLGSQAGFGPANARYTECRLTPLGEAALSSERGELGPLPIGLINGNIHVDGYQPPLDPRQTIAAIRSAPSVDDDELVAMIGRPSFPTGCAVDIDIAAWAAGSMTEATLTARIDLDGPECLVISHLPPGCTGGELAEAIAEGVNHERQAGDTAGSRDEAPHRRLLPIRDIADSSTSDEVRIVIDLLPGADADGTRQFISTLWGARRSLVVDVGTPVPDLVRRFAALDPDTLYDRLRLVEEALR